MCVWDWCGVQVGTKRYSTSSKFGVLPVIWCAVLRYLSRRKRHCRMARNLCFFSHFLFASPNIFISEKCFISGASEPSALRIDMLTHRLLFPRCLSCLCLCVCVCMLTTHAARVCVSDSVQKDYFVVSAFSTALRISVYLLAVCTQALGMELIIVLQNFSFSPSLLCPGACEWEQEMVRSSV